MPLPHRKEKPLDASVGKSTIQTPTLNLNWNVLVGIINTIGIRRAESGGALGGTEGANDITEYEFDKGGGVSYATYSPDTGRLNKLFKKDWNPKGIRLRGFVHSHPGRYGRPSSGDEVYAAAILGAVSDMECLWLPIINTIPDTDMFRMVPWVAYRKQSLENRSRRPASGWADTGVSIAKGRIRLQHAPSLDDVIDKVAGTTISIRAQETIRCDVSMDEVRFRVSLSPHSRNNSQWYSISNETSRCNEREASVVAPNSSMNTLADASKDTPVDAPVDMPVSAGEVPHESSPRDSVSKEPEYGSKAMMTSEMTMAENFNQTEKLAREAQEICAHSSSHEAAEQMETSSFGCAKSPSLYQQKRANMAYSSISPSTPAYPR